MAEKRKALVLGGRTGLLGQGLSEVLCKRGWSVECSGRGDLDIFAPDELGRVMDQVRPDCVFNAVGYTLVDQAEDEPRQAMRLNKTYPALLAKAMLSTDATLVHFSTDFVFDGRQDVPYTTEDKPNPLGEYGRSKLAGEQALLGSGLENLLILRTAWLFGPWKTNFVKKILEAASTRETLSVVHDQVGSPTYTLDLAEHALQLLDAGATGLYHVVNSGQASWCDLATEAVRLAGINCRILPIPSSEYPQKARRPSYSVLDTSKFTAATKVRPRAWLQSLTEFLFHG